MLVQRDRGGKLAGRHQLADQRVAFAKIDLLLGEPAPKFQALFFAARFHQRAEQIILFRVPTELAFPARLQQVFVALRRGVGGNQFEL